MRDSKRDTDVSNSVLDSAGEGEGGMIWENGIETCIISYKKWISSLVWCRVQDAWGWCTGMTQRDGVRGEVGEGFRMGNTCTLVADSCWCVAKPIQYCKVKNNNSSNNKKTAPMYLKVSQILTHSHSSWIYQNNHVRYFLIPIKGLF